MRQVAQQSPLSMSTNCWLQRLAEVLSCLVMPWARMKVKHLWGACQRPRAIISALMGDQLWQLWPTFKDCSMQNVAYQTNNLDTVSQVWEQGLSEIEFACRCDIKSVIRSDIWYKVVRAVGWGHPCAFEAHHESLLNQLWESCSLCLPLKTSSIQILPWILQSLIHNNNKKSMQGLCLSCSGKASYVRLRDLQARSWLTNSTTEGIALWQWCFSQTDHQWHTIEACIDTFVSSKMRAFQFARWLAGISLKIMVEKGEERGCHLIMFFAWCQDPILLGV